jgi:hypothetical protein
MSVNRIPDRDVINELTRPPCLAIAGKKRFLTNVGSIQHCRFSTKAETGQYELTLVNSTASIPVFFQVGLRLPKKLVALGLGKFMK